MVDDDMMKSGASARADNYKAWAITKKVYGSFRSLPGSGLCAGPQYVLVPYSALKDLIKPDGPLFVREVDLLIASFLLCHHQHDSSGASSPTRARLSQRKLRLNPRVQVRYPRPQTAGASSDLASDRISDSFAPLIIKTISPRAGAFYQKSAGPVFAQAAARNLSCSFVSSRATAALRREHIQRIL